MNEKEFKVINALYENKSLYLREIAKKTALPYGTVQKILERNKEIIESREEGKNKYFSLKNILENKYLIQQLEIEKTKLFIKKNTKLVPFWQKLSEENLPILIFGSFAKNNQDKNSDIDLLIISEIEIKLPSHLTTHKLHSITLKSEKIKQLKIESLFKEIKTNHIILSGFEFFLQEVLKNE